MALAIVERRVLDSGVAVGLEGLVDFESLAIGLDRLHEGDWGSFLPFVQMARKAFRQVDGDLIPIRRIQSVVFCRVDELMHGNFPDGVLDWVPTTSVQAFGESDTMAVADFESLLRMIELLVET
jgi:hypothetical protein